MHKPPMTLHPDDIGSALSSLGIGSGGGGTPAPASNASGDGNAAPTPEDRATESIMASLGIGGGDDDAAPAPRPSKPQPNARDAAPTEDDVTIAEGEDADEQPAEGGEDPDSITDEELTALVRAQQTQRPKTKAERVAQARLAKFTERIKAVEAEMSPNSPTVALLRDVLGELLKQDADYEDREEKNMEARQAQHIEGYLRPLVQQAIGRPQLYGQPGRPLSEVQRHMLEQLEATAVRVLNTARQVGKQISDQDALLRAHQILFPTSRVGQSAKDDRAVQRMHNARVPSPRPVGPGSRPASGGGSQTQPSRRDPEQQALNEFGRILGGINR